MKEGRLVGVGLGLGIGEGRKESGGMEAWYWPATMILASDQFVPVLVQS